MKLLFSEATPDYANYIFPYAIWAFPEPGETPSDLFAVGFLPSGHNLDRYYLCRQIRVALPHFAPSSENRRVLRKGEGITCRLVARADFEFTSARKSFCKQYTETKFGPAGMSDARLDSLFNSAVTTHLLLFEDSVTGAEIGIVTLYLEPPRTAYYYYAFYDLAYAPRNLGMFMMTSAVAWMASNGFQYLHLGTCYSANALYKSQFPGVEFFNGFQWSSNLEELKHILARGMSQQKQHLLESAEFIETFHPQGLGLLTNQSGFKAKLPPPA